VSGGGYGGEGGGGGGGGGGEEEEYIRAALWIKGVEHHDVDGNLESEGYKKGNKKRKISMPI
jgi:hypothetical protein